MGEGMVGTVCEGGATGVGGGGGGDAAGSEASPYPLGAGAGGGGGGGGGGATLGLGGEARAGSGALTEGGKFGTVNVPWHLGHFINCPAYCSGTLSIF